MTTQGTETRQGQDLQGLGAKHDGPVGAADPPQTTDNRENIVTTSEQQAVPVAQWEDDDISFLRREIEALFARTKGISLRAKEWNDRGHAILDRLASLPCKSGEGAGEMARVKPLVWAEPHISHSYPNWCARVPSIMFEARIDTGRALMYGKFPLLINGTMVAEKFETVEAAKAYAESNYASRILALTPDATQTREAELAAALERLARAIKESLKPLATPDRHRAVKNALAAADAALNARGGA